MSTQTRAGRCISTQCTVCGQNNQLKEIGDARLNARVVIIGAGPAGLAAAQWLRGRGVDPLLLEARPRLGGRIQTVSIGGHPVDLGAAYIHGCDVSYNRVQLPTYILRHHQPRLSVFCAMLH